MVAISQNSLGFSADKFRQFVQNWPERPRLDFKEMISKLGSDKAQFEFVKDIIAFANVARRTGQECYIVFGVKEEPRTVHDVSSQFPFADPPDGLSIHNRQNDYVSEPLRKMTVNWVLPYAPETVLEYGIYEGKFVSWLEILPNTVDAEHPFALKKAFGSSSAGTVFVRCGSASIKVDPRQFAQLLRMSKVDYLRRKHWQSLVEHHRREGSEAHKFWMLPDYVEIKASTGASAERTVLQLLAEGKRQIHVTAPAGVGKTVLLQRLAYALSDRHPERVTDTEYFGQSDPDTSPPEVIERADLLEVVPPHPVPIYMELRATFDTEEQFAQYFVARVKEMLGHPSVRAPETLFAIPNSKWILLLDGVDELGNREQFGDKLQGWIKRLRSNVQVVLSARPYAAHIDSADAHVSLAALDQPAIVRRLEQLPVADLVRLHGFLEEQPDLYKLLGCHRRLNGLLASARRGTAADAPSPVRSEIDQPKVELQEVISPTLSSGGFGEVPVRTADEGPTPGAGVKDESQNELPPLPLELAELLEGMVNEMQEQEVERRSKLGFSANDLARRSLAHLHRVGWEVEWDRDDFDPYRVERKGWLEKETRHWNEEIGFVSALPDGQAQFVCGLFHCYLAAKFGARAHGLDRVSVAVRLFLHYLVAKLRGRESDDVARELAAAQTSKPKRAELVLRLLCELRARRGAQVPI